MSATPHYLPSETGTVFCWWHAPVGKVRGAVVLQGAWGYEHLCTHWATARLANLLAEQGFGVVRADLLGTGDSGDSEGTQFEGWKLSLELACEAAVKWAGVDALAIVGLRLGATLGAAFAAEHGGVKALALVEPATSGRTFIREQKALALTSNVGIGEPSAATDGEGNLDLLGHPLTAATQTALGGLDLKKLGAAPAPEVLYQHRPDRPFDAKFQAALEKLGVKVTVHAGEQLPELFQDGVVSKWPEADFAQLSQWLVDRFPAGDAVAPGPVGAATRLEQRGFHEEAVLLGGDRQLAGIACFPTTPKSRTALVVLNTGANHRIGAHRLSVELMRTLALEGISSLRLDVSGIGDTPLRDGQRQNFPYNFEIVSDARAAVDWLQSRGLQRFVLSGVCSGGYLSFQAALVDPRVRGIVLINAQRFERVEGLDIELQIRSAVKSTRHYQQRIRDPQIWLRLFKGEVDVRTVVPALAARLVNRARRLAELRFVKTFGTRFERDPVTRGFLELSARDVKIAFVVSRDDGARDVLAGHLGPGLGRLEGHKNVSLEVLDGADHTLTQGWARQRMFDTVRNVLRDAAR